MGTAVRKIKNNVVRVMGVCESGLPVVVHLRPKTVPDDPVLPGLALDLGEIW